MGRRRALVALVVGSLAAAVALGSSFAGQTPPPAHAAVAARAATTRCPTPKPPPLPVVPGAAIVGYLALGGGPLDPRCRRQLIFPVTPTAGRVTLADASGHTVATLRVGTGQTFALPVAPGRYTVTATVRGEPTVPGEQAASLPCLRTTRRHPLDGSSGAIAVAAGQRVTTLCVLPVP